MEMTDMFDTNILKSCLRINMDQLEKQALDMEIYV